MIDRLLSRLNGKYSAQIHEEEIRIAVAALMVAMIRSIDLDFGARPRPSMLRALQARYGLTYDEAVSLASAGCEAESASVDAFQFSHFIKVELSIQDREALIGDMWRAAGSEAMQLACAPFMGRLGHLLDMPTGSVKPLQRRLEE